MKEGIKPKKEYNGLSERQNLLKQFAEGKYKALVAMKCLDEGVDVPSAKTAIIMSSTGNPIQYIQRRGRILRRFKGKEKAVIYDLLVIPDIDASKLNELEIKILKKELVRYKEFCETSNNCKECTKFIEEFSNKIKIDY